MRYLPNRRNVLQLAAAYGLFHVSPVFASNSERFNIFFDFESTETTASAAELMDIVAREILPIARVSLIGHADTAEAQPERISYARGNEVLKYFLRKQSLARVRFNVVSGGIADPLVKTGPNTKEPRNRRVEIKFEI
jgi:OOP family OmpA-OmpF porin